MSAPSGVNAFISPCYSTSRKSYYIAISTQLQQYSLCKREIETVYDDRDSTLSVRKGKQKKGLQAKRSGLNLTQPGYMRLLILDREGSEARLSSSNESMGEEKNRKQTRQKGIMWFGNDQRYV